MTARIIGQCDRKRQIKKCLECGSDILGRIRTNTKYCGRACYFKHRNNRKGNKCLGCKAYIEGPERFSKKYCNRDCYEKTKTREAAKSRKHKECPECQLVFVSKAEHCSRSCASKAREHNRKIRKCRECKSDIEGQNRLSKIYCSESCKQKNSNPKKRKVYNNCFECKSKIEEKTRTRGKYCSKDCYDNYQAKSKIKKECDFCGQIFTSSITKRGKHVRYCSPKCRKSAVRPPPKNCANCGVYFSAIGFKEGRMYGKRNTIYCSDKCSSQALSNNKERKEKISAAFSGEKHPNWQGGSKTIRRGYRGPGWTKIADGIRKRDKHRCRHCDMTEEENGKKLDVHHLIPFRQSPTVKANKPSNLISLCQKCHTEADFNYRHNNPIQMVLL